MVGWETQSLTLTIFLQVWTYPQLKTSMNKIHFSEIITTWTCLKEWVLAIKDIMVHSLANQTWVVLSNKRLLKACQCFKRISWNHWFKSTDTKVWTHCITWNPNHNSFTFLISKNNVLSKKRLTHKLCFLVVLHRYSAILEKFIMLVVLWRN